MDDTDLRLDGNAAAGWLQEVFPFEMTLVRTTCSTCAAVEPLGDSHAYANAPGVVVRCRHCHRSAACGPRRSLWDRGSRYEWRAAREAAGGWE